MKTVIENLLAEYDMINSAFAKDLREALAEQPAQTATYTCGVCGVSMQMEQPAQPEPVLWQILNGVCHAGVRSTENLAKEAAAGMQKTHDLGGSLAAFHVRPLYTAPQQRKPLTDEQQIAEALRRHGLTLVKTAKGYDVMSLGHITAHGIKENT